MSDDQYEGFPPVEYPHPCHGYEWESNFHPIPGKAFGKFPDKYIYTVFEIAKSARSVKEIWENYKYVVKYWLKYGGYDDEKYFVRRPILGPSGMLDSYYRKYLEENDSFKNYYSMAHGYMNGLMWRWALGELPLDDDEQAVQLLQDWNGMSVR